MDKKQFQISAIIVVVVFLTSIGAGATTNTNPHVSEANGKVDVVTNQATISVTGGGNIPFYHIQSKNSNTNYLVKFVSLEEFNDKNNDGQFQHNELVPKSYSSFPSLGWKFSGFLLTNDSSNNIQKIDFSYNSSTIELDNHINVANGNQIKFDIIINQYSWLSTSSSLAIKLQISGGSLSKNSEGNDVSFGNAYLKTVTTAQPTSGNVPVSPQVDSANSLYILINHFDGKMILDPLFGVTNTSGNSGSSSNSTNTAGLELFPILGSCIAIGIIGSKKRYHN